MRRKTKSGRNNAELLQLRDAALKLGSASPQSNSGFTRREFEAFNRPEDITVFRRPNWTGCFFEREAERRRSAATSSAGSADAINWWEGSTRFESAA